jgi:hypothetical protein
MLPDARMLSFLMARILALFELVLKIGSFDRNVFLSLAQGPNKARATWI